MITYKDGVPVNIKVTQEQFNNEINKVVGGWNKALEKATANQLPGNTLNQGAIIFQNS